jgi:hypothetical protein
VSEQTEQQEQPELLGNLALDLDRGNAAYVNAMQTILGKIRMAGYPGDPRRVANMLITETFQYMDGLLPGVDLAESASLFGAVMGLALAGHIDDGKADAESAVYLTEMFHQSFVNTIPNGIKLVQEAKKQAESVVIQPDSAKKKGLSVLPRKK